MCVPLERGCCCVSLEVATQLISLATLIWSCILLAVYTAAATLPLPPYRTLMHAVHACNAALHLLAACMLVYGAFMKRRRWMQPWVVVAAMSSAVLLVLAVLGLAAMLLAARLHCQTTYVLSAYALYAVLEYYMASVVWSRHRQLQREEASTDSAHTLLTPWAHAV